MLLPVSHRHLHAWTLHLLAPCPAQRLVRHEQRLPQRGQALSPAGIQILIYATLLLDIITSRLIWLNLHHGAGTPSRQILCDVAQEAVQPFQSEAPWAGHQHFRQLRLIALNLLPLHRSDLRALRQALCLLPTRLQGVTYQRDQRRFPRHG
jgi:hypothetical protein